MTSWYCVTVLFLSSNNVTAYLVAGSSLKRDSWTSLNRDFPLPRHLLQGVPTTVRDRATPAWPVFSPGVACLKGLPREASDTDAQATSAGSSRCGGAADLRGAPHPVSTLPDSFQPTVSGILLLQECKFSNNKCKFYWFLFILDYCQRAKQTQKLAV